MCRLHLRTAGRDQIAPCDPHLLRPYLRFPRRAARRPLREPARRAAREESLVRPTMGSMHGYRSSEFCEHILKFHRHSGKAGIDLMRDRVTGRRGAPLLSCEPRQVPVKVRAAECGIRPAAVPLRSASYVSPATSRFECTTAVLVVARWSEVGSECFPVHVQAVQTARAMAIEPARRAPAS